MKIEGVDGESLTKLIRDGFSCKRQWAEENAGRWGFGSGGGSGKVEMKDFEFRMVSNKASPKLFLMCATGGIFLRQNLFAVNRARVSKILLP